MDSARGSPAEGPATAKPTAAKSRPQRSPRPRSRSAKPAAKARPVVSARAASAPPSEPLAVGDWVPPPPSLGTMPPTGNPPSRVWQAIGFVAAAALVLAVGVVLLLRPVLSQDDDQTDPGKPAQAIPFEPPVAMPGNGSYVETIVLPSGDLQVTHWIRTRVPQFSIKLIAPELAGVDSGVVTAKNVTVAADGRVVPGADSVETVSQSYQFFGTKAIYVSYVLSGAMERSTSVEGRALARITALDLRYVSMGGVSQRSVQGAEVLNLACSARNAPDAVPEPCGEPGPDGWQVRLAGASRNDRVMAQLQLS